MGLHSPLKEQVRSLGVLLEPSLSLEAQVASVARSAFYQLRLVAQSTHYQLQLVHQLCLFLDRDSLAMVIHALVTSRLDYYNVLHVCGLEAEASAERGSSGAHGNT